MTDDDKAAAAERDLERARALLHATLVLATQEAIAPEVFSTAALQLAAGLDGINAVYSGRSVRQACEARLEVYAAKFTELAGTEAERKATRLQTEALRRLPPAGSA